MTITYLLIIIICIGSFFFEGFKGGIIFSIYIIVSINLAFWLSFKRINPFLVYIRYKKELSQMISFRLFIKNLFKNNFNSQKGEVCSKYIKEVLSYNKNLEEFFTKTKSKKINTTTHEVMYKQLCKYEKKNIISINKVSNKKCVKLKKRSVIFKNSIATSIVKIDFIGLKSYMKNKGCKEFQEYMKEPFKFSKYEIILEKANDKSN